MEKLISTFYGTNLSLDDGIAILYKLTARLLLRVFHLYSSSSKYEPLKLCLLYETVCSVIDEIKRLQDTIGLASYCTHYIYAMLALSAFTLLKLVKIITDDISPYRAKGKLCYFQAIALCKQVSVENNDLASKTSEILSLLWLSDIFANPEISWPLRIRSRLSMSIVLIVYGGGEKISSISPLLFQFHVALRNAVSIPHITKVSVSTNNDAEMLSGQNTAEMQTPISKPSPEAQSSLFDEQWLYDIDWAVGSESWMENFEARNMQSWPPVSGCIA